MKKLYVLLLLLATTSIYPVFLSGVLWTIIGPIQSADEKAEARLKYWHQKNNTGTYCLESDLPTNDGLTIGYFRKKYPEDDPTSSDRLARAIILAEHGRLLETAVLAPGKPMEVPDQISFFLINPETTWKHASFKHRCWWTLRYRKPYTHFLSLGKWALEAAIIIGYITLACQSKKVKKNEEEASDEELSLDTFSSAKATKNTRDERGEKRDLLV